MDRKTLREIIACLPEGRTFFHYHRDRYATYLLEHLVQRGRLKTVADLKHSPYAGWLQKPLLRDALATLGRTDVPLSRLCEAAWCHSTPTTYLLSLGEWGSEKRKGVQQTSRTGCNLVLLLNLPLSHEAFLHDVSRVTNVDWLRYWGHPCKRGRITLAWCRMDIDLESGIALIEEVQSDWIRRIRTILRRADHAISRDRPYVWYGRQRLTASRLQLYQPLIAEHEKLWHEAMLTAALWFLFEEIGIREVFYHSWHTGAVLKGIRLDEAPPRSIYSDLPERFAFSQRDHGPDFIECLHRTRKLRAKTGDWNWYHWAA